MADDNIDKALPNVEQTIKLNSIQVPLSVGWRLINLKVVNIRIMGGVTANFITHVEIDNDPPTGSDYWITKDDFKNVQWQWQLGAGVDVFMFALDVKYFGGINDIMNTDITVDAQNFSVSSKSCFILSILETSKLLTKSYFDSEV